MWSKSTFDINSVLKYHTTMSTQDTICVSIVAFVYSTHTTLVQKMAARSSRADQVVKLLTGRAVVQKEIGLKGARHTLRSTSLWSMELASLVSLTVSSLKRRNRSDVCFVFCAASVGDGAAASCPAMMQVWCN